MRNEIRLKYSPSVATPEKRSGYYAGINPSLELSSCVADLNVKLVDERFAAGSVCGPGSTRVPTVLMATRQVKG